MDKWRVTLTQTVCILGCLFFVASCGSSSTDTSTTLSTAVSSTSPTQESLLTLYLVESSDTTFEVVPVELASTNVVVNDTDEVTLALKTLFQLTDNELDSFNAARDSHFETAVPSGTQLLGVQIDNGTITVNLGGSISSSSGSSTQETLFSEQLTRTALVDESLTGVLIQINGVQVDELWGHLDWSQPITLT